MKRLLCIASSLNAGGAETFMIKVFRKLDKSKYIIDFAVSEKEDGFYTEEVKKYGSKVYYVPPHSENFIKSFIQIQKIVKNGRYIAVLKLCSTPIGSVDLLAATIGGAKKRICRSCNAGSIGGSITKVKDWIFRYLVNAVTNVYIAPSDLAAEYMFGKSVAKSDKIIYLRNGIDLSDYSFSNEYRESYRKKLGLEDSLVIGHVGRFSEQKNHSFLIDIFREIHNCIPDSKLVLVGEGILQEDIKEKVSNEGLKKNVLFLGLRRDVNKLLSAMDVIVFPSFFEGMPNVIIEAQSTGLPCVISKSITNEANVTGSVKYLSLYDSPKVWADVAIAATKAERQNTKELMIKAGYDIEDVVDSFIANCF